MNENTLINGVDVTIVQDTVSAIQEKPDLAQCKFRLHNKWINGGLNQSTVGNFCYHFVYNG